MCGGKQVFFGVQEYSKQHLKWSETKITSMRQRLPSNRTCLKQAMQSISQNEGFYLFWYFVGSMNQGILNEYLSFSQMISSWSAGSKD